MIVGWWETNTTIVSVIDSSQNIYSLAVGPTVQAGDGVGAIYYAKNITGAPAGTNTVTVTFSQPVSAPDLRILEYSGVDTANPVDVVAANTGSSAAPTAGPLTTTVPNDIIVAGNFVYTYITAAGSGFTNRMFTSDGDNVEDELVPAVGTYTATAVESPSGAWVMQAVAFRPAASTQSQAATPTISPTGGTIATTQQISISDTTPGYAIYYTTNNTAPSVTPSELYSGPFTLSASGTVKAMAVASGYTNSNVASAVYTLQQAATPTFNEGTGTYTGTQSITLSDTTSGATIYYAINSAPTTSSTKYVAGNPISVSSSETIEAMAVGNGYAQSTVASATYTISSQAAPPTFSEGTGTYTGTQSIKLSDTTSGATIYYAINSAPTTSSTKYVAGNPISVSSSETIEAMAVASGYTQSTVASATYTINPVQTSTITYVQGTYANPGSAQTENVTYPLAQVSGDLNVVIVGWWETNATIVSVTDSSQNIYSLAVGPTVLAGDGVGAIYYAKNISGAPAGTNTVTVTFSQPVSAPDLRILEYSGVDTANPVDVVAAGTGSSATPTAGPLTTTAANDIIVAGNFVYTYITGAGSGFTNRMYTPDGDNVEDELVPAVGTYTATAVESPGSAWVMQAVAFRPASH